MRIFAYGGVSGIQKKRLVFLSKLAHDDSVFSTLEFLGEMSADPEDEDEFWFRPPWETEDQASLEPPGPPLPRARKAALKPDFNHPLLTPLAAAQDAIARLEAKTETASEAVAEGLRTRMAYLEAAGWLAHAHVWIYPWDLALRDNLLTGSYAAAAFGDRLKSQLPSTVAQEIRMGVGAFRYHRQSRLASGAAVAAAGRSAPGGPWPTPVRCAKRFIRWAGVFENLMIWMSF